MAEGGGPHGIQSVEIAGQVLRALQSLGGSAALGDLAGAAGLQRSKAHRYLASLVRVGLVQQDPSTGHYALGRFALSLGLMALRRQNPVSMAVAELGRLRDATDQTATLAVWGSVGPVVVGLEPSRRPVTLNVRIGTELPADTTALGRVFAIWGPSADPAHRALRTASHVRIDGTLLPGISAIAAPVFGHDGALVMAAGIVGQTDELSVLPGPAAAVARFAETLSDALGYCSS